MSLILKMAWRNIFRHRGKTFVIGTILFVGALIMTIGNGIISGMEKGLQQNIIQSFTGDILLISEKQESDAVLLGMSAQTVSPFKNYDEIRSQLEHIPEIQSFLPGGIGYVWVLSGTGQLIDQYILGVDFPAYQEFFNQSISTVEGRLLGPGEKGVLVPTQIRKMIFDFCNYWTIPKNTALNHANLTSEAKAQKENLEIKNEMIYMGLSKGNSSLDIAAPVVGVVKYRALNSILGMYSLIDVESFRECMGFLTAGDTQITLNKTQQPLFSDDQNMDTMFSSSIESAVKTAAIRPDQALSARRKASATTVNIEQGMYNLVFIKLLPGISADKMIGKLNRLSAQNHLGIKAISWKASIGMMGQMAGLMKGALLLFVGIIFFVAIIIIMNTLSMAAMERTSEIGMMRAVGAQKGLIARLFFMETLLLSLSFGGAGIMAAAAIIKLLATLKLTTENEVLQIFYGGNTFHPVLDIQTILLCVVQLLIVTGLAVIYPMVVARKITPLEAISRD